MSADLVLHQDHGSSEPSADAAAALVSWAQAATAAHGLAQSLVRTSFVPQRYRGKPDEATAAILAGAELGLSPLASLRAFDDIQGTVAAKAVTLVAVAQSRGHHIEVVEESDERAVVRYRRRGEREWRRTSYSVADAQQAGLVTRNPNWRTQPRAMCVARASSIAARRVASDAILGIAYSAEELSDTITIPAAERRVTADELTIPDVTRRDPALVSDRIPQDDDPPEPVGDQRAATRDQITKIILMLRDLDIEDEDAQRAWLAEELRRPVTSRNNLNRAEASTVIEVLQVMIDARGEQPGDDQ